MSYSKGETKVNITRSELRGVMISDVGDDRLAALCQYCHLNYDANEKWRRALAKAG